MKTIELSDVKQAIASKSPVKCDGIQYNRITACIMRSGGTEWIYTVELEDKCNHSVTIAELKKVEVIDRCHISTA